MTEGMNNIAINLKGISKKYKLYANKTDRMKEALSIHGKTFHKEFYALSEINLQVRKGEILGIVGKNGSGKSTLLKIISGILQPSTGSVKTIGRVIPLLELGNGFNPEFTGLENIYFYNSFLGFSRKETDKRLHDIINFADIGDFLYQPLKTYSSGMKARLSFAVSVNIDPDILIIDEVLAVGDELFRRKSYSKMEELFKSGTTVLFVSHNLNTINQLCPNSILLEKGEIVGLGKSKEITAIYERKLFGKTSLPQIDSKRKNSKENVLAPAMKSKKHFLEGFAPKSTIVTDNKYIEVISFNITDDNNEIVNVLKTNNTYKYTYIIKFTRDCFNVNFSFAIKDEKGALLSYGFDTVNPSEMKNPKSGDLYKITWEFKCLFSRGLYYTNFGIRTYHEGEISFLHRIVDASVFKIDENYNSMNDGMIHLNKKCSVNFLK